MAPQTRSATKHSPGRMTRNSIFGRPPLSPPKPRSRSPTKTSKYPTLAAQAHQENVALDGNVNHTTVGTPWLACRDVDGIRTSVAVSETGEGIHIRWHYQEDDADMYEIQEQDNEDAADVEMSIADTDERGITPITIPTQPTEIARRAFPRTPLPPHPYDPYDAGSVIRTPVKKAKPLQPSPPRIGDKGIRCLYQQSGVLRDFNGVARIVLRHPAGSTANMLRHQVEGMENERDMDIVLDEVERLLAEKRRIEEEDQFTDQSGDGDETPTEVSDNLSASSIEDMTNETLGLRRRRFGPEGTELIL